MFEMFQLEFITQAFILTVIVGILLSYLGVHVVGRGIVFVDLALGQISSLGVAFSDYVGRGKTTIPILFTLLGAFLMSLIHIKDRRLKLEAIIGIIYAVASAATVLLISKTPHGDSDIQEVLFGNILSVSWEQIRLIGIVFGVIALLQIIFFKKFQRVTDAFANTGHAKDSAAFRSKGEFRIWNFLFYISIGLTIVFAVRTSGVIPVFSFLIIPSVAALMIARKNSIIVFVAALISVLGALFGLQVSYNYDLPAGSSIVAVLGGLFLLACIYYTLRSFRSGNKKSATG
jgi:zinc/manganese transport system permease protein